MTGHVAFITFDLADLALANSPSVPMQRMIICNGIHSPSCYLCLGEHLQVSCDQVMLAITVSADCFAPYSLCRDYEELLAKWFKRTAIVTIFSLLSTGIGL